MKLTREFLENTRNPDDGSYLQDDDVKQILDDYEKARKWEEHDFDYCQAKKLRELIEKRIKELKEIAKVHFNARDITSERETDQIIDELQKLLEESKK